MSNKSAKERPAIEKKGPLKEKKKGARKKPSAGALKKALAPTEADFLLKREEGSERADSRHIVTFYLDDKMYAVDVAYVGAVINSREVAQLPNTPVFIEGLVSVRGEMVLVMNLKRRLGIGSKVNKVGNIIITESLDHEIGILVDKMAGVMEAPNKLKPLMSSAASIPSGFAAEDRSFIKGIVRQGDKVVGVLDMERLMDFKLSSEAI